MGIFAHRNNKILKGARTMHTWTTSTPGVDIGSAGFEKGIAEALTSSAPEDSLDTLIDVTGKAGLCHGLVVFKDTTSNSVAAHAKITVDGTVVLNDISLEAAGTVANYTALIGQVTKVVSADDEISLIPTFLPFNQSFKVEVRYSGATGNAADIVVYQILSYVA